MLSVTTYLIASVLPGAWFVFVPTMAGMTFWTRLLIGFVLSPLITFIQFYLFRATGLTFDLSVYAILIINLPILYFLYKKFQRPDRQAIVDALNFFAVLSVPLIFLAIKFYDIQLVAYTGHGWMHSDSMYSLSNGFFVPDEAELAGAMHAYPWAGHLYHAVLSYLIDTPPVASYHVTNILWLTVLLLLGSKIVKSVGGDKVAQLTSVIWLCFGVNLVGYMLTVWPLNYISWFRDSGVWGHENYSPWIEKYFFFSFMPIGLCLFGAAAYLMTLDSKTPPSSSARNRLVGLLAVGLGLLYPILFPALLGLIGALGLVTLLDKNIAKSDKKTQLLQLIAIILVSGATTFLYLYFLSVDRVNHTVTISSIDYIVTKLIRTFIVLSPLLVGAVIALPSSWRHNRNGSAILLLGAFASGFLHCAFSLTGGGENEYKYIFTAAICLAPFPSLALQRVFANHRNWRTPVFMLITVILVAPLVHKLSHKDWGRLYPVEGARPELDVSSYNLKLADTEPMREIYEAIRQRTTPGTIVVVLQSDIHIPTLTQRSLYVSPFREKSRVGVSMPVDRILKQVKGFDPSIVDARREVVQSLFRAKTIKDFEEQLDQILYLDRPLAIIMNNSSDSELIALVANSQYGHALYQDDKNTVWYINNLTELKLAGTGAENE